MTNANNKRSANASSSKDQGRLANSLSRFLSNRKLKFKRELVLICFGITFLGLLIVFGGSMYKTYKTSYHTNQSLKSCINSSQCSWEVFSKIAFGLEFQQKYPEIIKKFNSSKISIGYHIENDQNQTLIQSFLTKYFDLIDYHTNLELEFSKESPDILMFFVNDYDFKSKPEILDYVKNYLNQPSKKEALKTIANQNNNLCYAIANTNKQTGQINKAVIFIRSTLKSFLLDTCIQEEITQAMGLLNDVKGGSESHFIQRQHHHYQLNRTRFSYA